jgi:hypothetical protein
MYKSTAKIEFYVERANAAAEEARDATLTNVRERALRSETAWRGMADRAIAIEKARAHKVAEVNRSHNAESTLRGT